MRAVFFDHVYEDAWAAHRCLTMEGWFAHCFGTSDFWACELREAGHEAKTLVLNAYPSLREMVDEARAFAPTHLVSMEVGRFHSTIAANFPNCKTVAFCSHRASEHDLSGWDVVFSSFPWMPAWCKTFGQRCEYLSLAFGRQVLDRVKYDGPRDIPVAFIGGLGDRIWKRGTEVMAKIAEAVPEFQWFGYCAGSVPESLQKVHRPAVYGADYYRLLMRTRICLNRHGEIAENFANNCRVYEAGGSGCYLLNDCEGELKSAVRYRSPEDAIQWIAAMLVHPEIAYRHGETLRQEVLENHTYRNRLSLFLKIVETL